MKSLSDDAAEVLQVVAACIVPGVGGLDRAQRGLVFAIIDQALMDRPAAVRRQLAVFLAVLRWSPVVRFGTGFDRLSPERRERVLACFQRCPVGLLRKGFWGLKVLVFMGYYGRPGAWDEIGYTPRLEGREVAGA